MVRGVQRSSTTLPATPPRADRRIEPSDVGRLPEAFRRGDHEHRLECGDRRGAAEERRRERAEHRVAGHDGGGA